MIRMLLLLLAVMIPVFAQQRARDAFAVCEHKPETQMSAACFDSLLRYGIS